MGSAVRVRLRRGKRGPEAALDRAIDTGILVFEPQFVRRFYMDGGRLGLARKPGGTYLPRVRLWRPERWIASTVAATNPHPVLEEGLSRLRIPGAGEVVFRRALEMRGERILGPDHFAAYGPGFPVLVKILDAAEPIVLHFHARDEDVRLNPQRFSGQRFGKDEAYYFLSAPKGRVPYTHVGLHPGVTRVTLAEAVQQGGDRALDLSPVFYQRTGEGFFVPAGVPHRPGTALTLEIQQPSDVYTLLEPVSGGKRLSPQQMHPGFDRLDDALAFVDFNAAADSAILLKNRLTPEPITETRTPEAEEAWIFPPRLRRFTGKRLVVRGRFESLETGPYAVFVWRGRGRLKERRLAPGTELLLTAEAARRPHLFEAEGEPLEIFKLFPPDAGWWKGRGA